jgi:hypothetical protein
MPDVYEDNSILFHAGGFINLKGGGGMPYLTAAEWMRQAFENGYIILISLQTT